MGITHIVQFQFKSTASPDAVKDVRHLSPNTIPEILTTSRPATECSH